MRIAIIQFPGSNCERETSLAVKRAGMEPVECLWNSSKEFVSNFDGFILVGGFSYEDRARAGIIAALDPIMNLIKEQNDLGKPILGICNGAQILIEKGLVPGLKNEQLGVALTDNLRIKNGSILGSGYYNAWIHMRVSNQYQHNAFTRYLTPKNILSLPVAHAEGRFIIPHELLLEMQKNGQNVFQYCDESGNISSEFPINPNGSVNNIAGISNKSGNVLALMPHPERTQSCDVIFHSMRDYIAEGSKKHRQVMDYQPVRPAIISYDFNQKFEIILETILVDNHAASVENTLKNQNIYVKLKRYIHWELTCESVDIYHKILETGLLFNDRKENILTSTQIKNSDSSLFLIRPKEDIEGKKTKQTLDKHFNVSGLRGILKSTLWKIQTHHDSETNLLEKIIHSNILFNPYSYECYKY